MIGVFHSQNRLLEYWIFFLTVCHKNMSVCHCFYCDFVSTETFIQDYCAKSRVRTFSF